MTTILGIFCERDNLNLKVGPSPHFALILSTTIKITSSIGLKNLNNRMGMVTGKIPNLPFFIETIPSWQSCKFDKKIFSKQLSLQYKFENDHMKYYDQYFIQVQKSFTKNITFHQKCWQKERHFERKSQISKFYKMAGTTNWSSFLSFWKLESLHNRSPAKNHILALPPQCSTTTWSP